MADKKISEVAAAVGGPLTSITVDVYVPVAVSDGGGGFLAEDHVVSIFDLIDLLNTPLTDFVDDYMADASVLDIGTITAYLTPGNTSAMFLPPAIWQGAMLPQQLTPASNVITFDPLVPASPSTNLYATITANSTMTITSANLVPGLTYMIEVLASGGSWTLAFSGLGGSDDTSGVQGGITIASGAHRDIVIRKRQDGTLKIAVGPAED